MLARDDDKANLYIYIYIYEVIITFFLSSKLFMTGQIYEWFAFCGWKQSVLGTQGLGSKGLNSRLLKWRMKNWLGLGFAVPFNQPLPNSAKMLGQNHFAEPNWHALTFLHPILTCMVTYRALVAMFSSRDLRLFQFCFHT